MDDTTRAAAPHDGEEGIFPTFFMAGFECSTFLWKDGRRRDFVALTGHDRHLKSDYEQLIHLGIGVVREAVRWPFEDLGQGRYDWSSLDTVIDAAEACQVTPIWDLCHYGFPDGCDPFSEECVRRFAAYCRSTAERIVSRAPGPYFFTPINEITFFAAGGSDMGWMYPFARGRYAEFKRALCRMSIEGVKAIREVEPGARMIHVDPIIHTVPPPDRPDLADEAWQKSYDEAYEGWDMLAGRLHPELGGAPEILDIVGVNCYNYSQAQMTADGAREALGPRDPRRRPLSEQLLYAWQRYHRPIIIGETSGFQDRRAEWLRMTMEESMRALNGGIDLQGVCLYPCVDIPDWQSGEWAKIGMFDIENRETLERLPCKEYIEELRRWQKILDRAESLEPAELGPEPGRVQLSEIRECARRWEEQTSGSQTVRGRPRQAA